MFRHWQLRRRQKRVLATLDPTDPTITPEARKEVKRQYLDALSKIESEFDQLYFMKLLNEGHKYDIPVEFAPGTLMSLNTPEYRSNLRKRIDEEKTRRHEVNA